MRKTTPIYSNRPLSSQPPAPSHFPPDPGLPKGLVYLPNPLSCTFHGCHLHVWKAYRVTASDSHLFPPLPLYSPPNCRSLLKTEISPLYSTVENMLVAPNCFQNKVTPLTECIGHDIFMVTQKLTPQKTKALRNSLGGQVPALCGNGWRDEQPLKRLPYLSGDVPTRGLQKTSSRI